MSDSEGKHGGVPLLDDASDQSTPAPGPLAKRKREDEPQGSKRAAKRKKSKKPIDVDDQVLDLEKGVNHAIAQMDSGLMADHVAQRTKRFRKELSLVEMEDLHVPGTPKSHCYRVQRIERVIIDTTAFSDTRTADQLPAFLERFAGPRRSKKGRKLVNAPEAKGSPHTLVLASGGMRSADLARVLRKYQTKDSTVAKLFAKHIKLKEAIDSVKSMRIGIGVGTPQRIIDLLEDGALKADSVERLVIDASYIDQKKRGLLDMKETQAPLVDLLTRPEFKERYTDAEDKVEMLFF